MAKQSKASKGLAPASDRFTGVLATPLDKLPAMTFGHVPLPRVGGGIAGHVPGITNSQQRRLHKIQQQEKKLPALFEAYRIDPLSPQAERRLILAMAEQFISGFRVTRYGPPEGEGYWENITRASDEAARMVHLRAAHGLDEKAACEALSIETGETWEAVRKRLYKYAPDRKAIVAAQGATPEQSIERASLLLRGAFTSFAAVGAQINALDSEINTNGILAGVTATESDDGEPTEVQASMQAKPSVFLLTAGQESDALNLLHANLANGCNVVVRHIDAALTKRAAAILAEASKHKGGIFIVDTPGNMPVADILVQSFADHGLHGVTAHQAIGSFSGLPTPAIVWTGTRAPSEIHLFEPRWKPQNPQAVTGGLFGRSFRDEKD